MDLESSLVEIDRRLRELQQELEAVRAPPPTTNSPGLAPAPEPPAPPAEPPGESDTAQLIDETAARAVELRQRIDDLQRLGSELERATRELSGEHARAAQASEGTFVGGVAVRAGPFPNIAALGEFERALRAIPDAEEAYVRSFEGDRALVELRLARRVDLVAEMRRALPYDFSVVEAEPGELSITLRA